MAYGDTTITYPLVRPRISQGSTGTNIIYSQTVLSGPTRVGDAGTFQFRMDYVGLDVDPKDTFVFHNITADFYLTQGYVDYEGNETRRYYLQGQLYEPPSRQSSYSASFAVAAGWVHVELAGEQFGRTYDPTPYGTFNGTTLTLWNGATFTVTADGQIHEAQEYRNVTATGIDRANFAFTGSETTFVATAQNALNTNLLGTDLVYRTADLRAQFPPTDPGRENPPLFVVAPSATNRIWTVSVQGTVRRRRGSYSATWFFGTPPTPPEPTGTAGVNHGGTATAGVITGGALRTSQSNVHQAFVRGGALTGLLGNTTSIGSSSSDGGVINE